MALAVGVECPSCRKMVGLPRNKIHTLPRNLALENIVIRYTEERSKSIRKSLSLESPVSDLLSPGSDGSGGVSHGGVSHGDIPEFPPNSRATCELCEGHTVQRAAWYCLQCEVAYCHQCFAKFHPRRGALARHKVGLVLDLSCYDHFGFTRECVVNICVDLCSGSSACR